MKEKYPKMKIFVITRVSIKVNIHSILILRWGQLIRWKPKFCFRGEPIILEFNQNDHLIENVLDYYNRKVVYRGPRQSDSLEMIQKYL